ncbi:MAG: Ig-like domain-containing protein [Gemmatimonadota bacterium]|jgi:N-formylglutamate amidohydrolase
MRPAQPVRRWRPPRSIPAALVLLALACGGDSTAPAGTSIEVTPAANLLVGVGDQARYLARVTGPGSSGTVTWSTTDRAVATVDGSGLVTAVAVGTTAVVGEVDGATGSATVEVYVPPDVGSYEPGTPYAGRREYVEYVPGTLPVVISAPHGGDLTPTEIPPRTGGTHVTDSNTRELARAVRQAFLGAVGAAPHLVIMHLERPGLDANREIDEAAEGNPFAEQAWREYHAFIEAAEEAVEAGWGTGLYLDLHGQGHEIQRVELGYLLPAAALNLPDASLDSPQHASSSSLAALYDRTGGDFAALLRGPTSFGGLLQDEGYRAVPSPSDPGPGSEPYFSGGYSTVRHGSRSGGSVDGVQLELNFQGVRDTQADRAAFAAALARVVRSFLLERYGHDLPDGP